MTLCNHSSRVYADEYDMQGLLKVLADRIALNDADQEVYAGAHLTVNLLLNHTFKTQADFMAVFDQQLKNR